VENCLLREHAGLGRCFSVLNSYAHGLHRLELGLFARFLLFLLPNDLPGSLSLGISTQLGDREGQITTVFRKNSNQFSLEPLLRLQKVINLEAELCCVHVKRSSDDQRVSQLKVRLSQRFSLKASS
jgi:hypothetical protein